MRPIRALPLWLALPLLLALVLVPGGALLFTWQYHHRLQELEQAVRAELGFDLSRIQGQIERALVRGEREQARGELTALAVKPQVMVVVLTDEEGRILLASRFGLEGLRLDAALPAHDPEQFRRTLRESGLRITRPASFPEHFHLYAPVHLPPEKGRLRSDRSGVLFLDYSLTQDLAALRQFLWQEALLGGEGLALALLLLIGALHLLVTRPVTILQHVTRRLSRGELAARVAITGHGELARLGRDINEMAHHLAESFESLTASRQHLLTTLRSIGDGVIVTDPQGRVTRMNPFAEQLTGWPEKEARGRHLLEVFRIVNTETRLPGENPVERVIREGRVVGLSNHTALLSRHGREYQIADSAAPIRLPDGELLGVVLVFQDVTEEYRMRQELSRSHEQLERFASALPGVAFILDERGTCLRVFGAQKGLLFRCPRELLGRHLSELLPPDTAGTIMETIGRTLREGRPQRLEYPLRVGNAEYWFEGHTAVLRPRGEEPGQVAWLAIDVTERKQAEAHIERLAYYDALTDLPNRRLLMERLQHELVLARRQGMIGALLFLDLDHFKTLNDALGHDIGDALLQAVSARLRETLREEDTVARLGGDEFTVILPNLAREADEAATLAGIVAGKLHQAVREPYELGGYRHQATLSIGITLFPNSGETAEDLLRQADAAMYLSKSAGRDTISYYRPELQQAAEHRLRLERDLRLALEQEAFRLVFQPQCDCHGRITGLEALVRWHDPERGEVSPGEFIPVMEENGTIVELGEWVLRGALEYYRQWNGRLPGALSGISVNISSRQFRDPALVGTIRRLLTASGVPGTSLVLEITEGTLLDNLEETVSRLQSLQREGVRISIDDFGTGYSSLAYLRRLPLDELKIDRSFVDEVDRNPDDAAITEAIIGLAGHLRMTVVAEGVETASQLEFLVRHGCERFQGWHFSRPLEPEQIAALLESGGRLPVVTPA